MDEEATFHPRFYGPKAVELTTSAPWYQLIWHGIWAIPMFVTGAVFLLTIYCGWGKQKAIGAWADFMRKS